MVVLGRSCRRAARRVSRVSPKWEASDTDAAGASGNLPACRSYRPQLRRHKNNRHDDWSESLILRPFRPIFMIVMTIMTRPEANRREANSGIGRGGMLMTIA